MPPETAPGASDVPSTIVVVPTYNEAHNLPGLIAELRALDMPELCALIVDDNSPDGTGKIADELAERFPGSIRVKHRLAKEGLGRAYIDGFKEALALGARYVVQMDADFSHPPAAIPEMLALMPDYDVVIGSRYVSGGRVDERWSWWRRLLSWWANQVWARGILRLQTRDITAGFRCWRREALLGIGLDRVRSEGYAFQVEMTYLAERLGYRVKEIPIYFEDRHIGRSKMSMSVKLQGALDVIRIRRRHRHITRSA